MQHPSMAERQDYDIEQLGIFTPKAVPVHASVLRGEEISFLVANVKKNQHTPR